MSSPWTVQYHQQVLATDPIAYWPLNEKSGAVAYDWIAENGAQNGVHAGVTLWQDGIGDGFVCPYYDGANDYTNVGSVALTAAFNGREGSALLWAKVANVGVWTDGARRDALFLDVNATNYIILRKPTFNGYVQCLYVANGTNKNVFHGGGTLATVDWFCMGMSWSLSAGINGEMRFYYAGAQTGATQTALGTWAGAPANAFIGATNAVPANVWYGDEAHVILWDRPLPADEFQMLYETGVSQ